MVHKYVQLDHSCMLFYQLPPVLWHLHVGLLSQKIK